MIYIQSLLPRDRFYRQRFARIAMRIIRSVILNISTKKIVQIILSRLWQLYLIFQMVICDAVRTGGSGHWARNTT